MTTGDALSIRPARPDDVAAVLAVHGTPATEQARTAWRDMMAAPDLTVYLALLGDGDGGEPVGTASLLVMPNLGYDGAPSAFVEAVVVVTARRRQGIATRIVQRALDDARARGCDKIQLLSHKRHATDGAHDLYRKIGFVPEAEGFRLYLRSEPPGEPPGEVAGG